MRFLLGILLSAVLAAGANADDLDRINLEDKIVVATEAEFPPFEYMDGDKVVGFGSDLLAEVVRDMNVQVEQLVLPFDRLLDGLATEQFDLVATSVVITPERARNYAFTRPFASIENVVLVRADNEDIEDVAHLSGKVVATQSRSSTEALACDMERSLKKNGDGFATLRLLATYAEAVQDLKSGEADAVIIGSITADQFMEQMPGLFRVAVTHGEPVYLSWVVRPGNPELLGRVNDTITRLADSGELGDMQRRWIGATAKVPSEGYLPDGAVQ